MSHQYERIMKLHVIPRIGHMKLSAVRPRHVQTMLSALETAEVGARTRKYCHTLLHRAFVVAIKWQLIVRNPCECVDAPKVGDHGHFHDLRHSSASLMLADGVNVKAIQTILGTPTSA